jgi:hypothetical protein
LLWNRLKIRTLPHDLLWAYCWKSTFSCYQSLRGRGSTGCVFVSTIPFSCSYATSTTAPWHVSAPAPPPTNITIATARVKRTSVGLKMNYYEWQCASAWKELTMTIWHGHDVTKINQAWRIVTFHDEPRPTVWVTTRDIIHHKEWQRWGCRPRMTIQDNAWLSVTTCEKAWLRVIKRDNTWQP